MFKYTYVGSNVQKSKQPELKLEERIEIEKIRDVYINDKTQNLKQNKYKKSKPTSKN